MKLLKNTLITLLFAGLFMLVSGTSWNDITDKLKTLIPLQEKSVLDVINEQSDKDSENRSEDHELGSGRIVNVQSNNRSGVISLRNVKHQAKDKITTINEDERQVPSNVIELYKKVQSSSSTLTRGWPAKFTAPKPKRINTIPNTKFKSDYIASVSPVSLPFGFGKKRINFVSPTGQAGIVTQIVFDYDKNQVPVGISDAENVKFKLTPSAKGQLYFASPKRLIYQLDNALSLGTRYTVKIDSETFQFDTERPKIKKLKSEDYSTVPNNGELFIEFNQSMNMESLEKYSYFTVENDSRKIPVSITPFDPKRKYTSWHLKRFIPKNSYTIKSSIDLPKNSKIVMTVLAGAKSKNGTLSVERGINQGFRTAPEPAFLGLQNHYSERFLSPDTNLYFSFSTGVRVDDVSKSLRIYPSDGIEIKTVSSKWFSSSVYVDVVGLQTNKDYIFYFTTPIRAKGGISFVPPPYAVGVSNYLPFFQAPYGFSLQEKTDKPSVDLIHRNSKHVDVKGKNLNSAQDIARYLYKKGWGWISHKDVINYDYSKAFEFSVSSNVLAVERFSISDLLPATKYPIALEFKVENERDRVFSLSQFSNIGITSKIGRYDGLIWINKLSEGVSYPDVNINVYKQSRGKVSHLFSGVSDENGVLTTPGMERHEIDNLLITAETDSDFSFSLGNWNGGISKEDFNLYSELRKSSGLDENYYSRAQESSFNRYQEKTRSMIFLERKLYSPGETMNFKITARTVDNRKLSTIQNKELTVQIFNSKGQKVFKKDLAVDSFSSVNGNFSIPESAPLGNYRISCLDAQLSFQVQEFKTQNFDVSLSSPKTGTTAGDTIDFSGLATYLQGGVMKNVDVTTWIKQSSSNFRPKGYPFYSFTYSPNDEGKQSIYKSSETLLNKTIKTNKDGLFNTEVPTKKWNRASRVVANFTVQDIQGERQTKSQSADIHPADYYLGISHSKSLVQAGQSMSLNLIAVKPNGEKVPTVTVSAKIYFMGSDVLKYKSLGNTFLTKQTPKRQLIEEREFDLSDTHSTFNFLPPHAGAYSIVFNSEDVRGNIVKSSRVFNAYGHGDPNWQLYDHDRIDLEPDKPKYDVGDIATILVKSPISKGSALVTIEIEGILDQFVLDINSASPVIEFPIKDVYFPNAYVSVTLIQGRVSEPPKSGIDLGKPTFRVGYINLNVESPKHGLTLNLKTDKESYEPREDVTLDIDISEITDKTGVADIAIAVVDESVLNLAPNKISPKHSFFKTLPLLVWTSQNRIHFKGRRLYGQKGISLGGGGGNTSLKGARDLFLNSVYWNPSVKTDKNGKASVSFPVPDNLTTFRVIAFAQTKGAKFGVSETTFKVKKELSLFTVFPDFLVQGDTFTAGVNIHNQSVKTGVAEVTAVSDTLSIKDNVQKVDIIEKSVAPAMFSFNATKRGESSFGFNASFQDLEDSIKKTVFVHDPVVYETAASYGQLRKGVVTSSIKVPDAAAPNYGHIKVSLSGSKFASVEGAANYLKDYSHYCLEQQFSKTVGNIGLTVLSGKEANELSLSDSRYLKHVFRNTRKYFGSDNGLRFWPMGRYSSPYLSSYISQVLLDYKDLGFDVPKDFFRKLDSYFKGLLTDSDLSQANQLFAFNYLAKRGHVRPATVERLLAKMSNYSLTEKLLFAEGLYYVKGQSAVAKRVFQECKNYLSFESGETFFDEKESTRFSYMIHPRLYSNILGLKTMLTFTPEDPLVFQLANYLSTTQLKKGFWMNTQENAQMILAMLKFRNLKESSETSFETEVSLNNTSQGNYSVTKITSPSKDFVSPIKQISKESTPLTFRTKGNGTGYYRTEVRYAIPAEDSVAKNHGFQVNRSYFNSDNERVGVDSFKVGELYRVFVTMQINERKDFIVLEDFLPAGFSIINPALGGANTLIRNTFATYFKHPTSTSWTEHLELRPERASAYSTNLRKGTYSFSYFVRAAHPGRFTALAPKAEELYSPEVFGNGTSQTISIRP